MRKLLTALTVLILGAGASTASAQGCCPCNPCMDPCGFGGTFMAGAHALYWKPSHCAYEYARSSTNESVVTVQDIKADYDWGFRVMGGYYRNCTYLTISYLWLETDDKARADLPEAIGLAGDYSQVRGRLFFKYQNVDLRVGQYLHRRSGCAFDVFANVRWVDLRRCNRVEGLSAESGNGRWTQKASYEGAGLGVGTAGEFCLCEGLDAFGEFNLMAVIGNRDTPKHRTVAQGATEATHFRFSSSTCVIPALDFRIGLSYAFDCYCASLIVEVGYEMNYYWNALEYESPTTRATSGARDCFDVGFAGPYVGGRVMF